MGISASVDCVIIKEFEKLLLKQKICGCKDIRWDIVERSAKLRREMKLKTPDAIQLATTELSGANIFFLK